MIAFGFIPAVALWALRVSMKRHYTGTDFLEERDGRVSRLYTFIDQKLFQS